MPIMLMGHEEDEKGSREKQYRVIIEQVDLDGRKMFNKCVDHVKCKNYYSRAE